MMLILNKDSDYFDWIFHRLAFASGSYWKEVTFEHKLYKRIGFGFYWRLTTHTDKG